MIKATKDQKAHDTRRIDRKASLMALRCLRLKWKDFYQKACRVDNIPENTQFAVFSENNPWAARVDMAAQEYLEAVRQYQSGGIIGIHITTTRKEND